MSRSQEKIAQYLYEARASELALVTTLRAHIAMAPSGSYRSGLERHLEETKGHAERLQRRLGELDAPRTPLRLASGMAQGLIGQAFALGKGPLDLVRGYSPEEKLLKNAKDECATEAYEIATYDALERLATDAGDTETARLAAELRSDEEAMLKHLRREIPTLTDAMVRAELRHDPTFDPSRLDAAGEKSARSRGPDAPPTPPSA